MLDSVAVELDRNLLGFEEKLDILLGGGCKSIFPLSITEDESGLRGYYRVAGYKQLCLLKGATAWEALTIVEKTVEALEECRQHLIFTEELTLNTRTVYIDGGFERIKLIYAPRKKCAEQSAAACLAAFIDELKGICGENGRTYLETLKEMFSVENLSLSSATAFLLRLKREVNLCGIV